MSILHRGFSSIPLTLSTILSSYLCDLMCLDLFYFLIIYCTYYAFYVLIYPRKGSTLITHSIVDPGSHTSRLEEEFTLEVMKKLSPGRFDRIESPKFSINLHVQLTQQNGRRTPLKCLHVRSSSLTVSNRGAFPHRPVGLT